MLSTRRRALSLSTTQFEQKPRPHSVCTRRERSSSEESFDFDKFVLTNIWSSMDVIASGLASQSLQEVFDDEEVATSTSKEKYGSSPHVRVACKGDGSNRELEDIFGERLGVGEDITTHGLNNKKYKCLTEPCIVTSRHFQDVCDGIMNDAMPVTLTEKGESNQWMPRRIGENEIMEAKFVRSSIQLYAWYVADSTEHYAFGFEDPRVSGKYYYVTIVGEGLLRLSSEFDPPYNISPSDVKTDARVLRYFKSMKSGQYVLSSAKYPELFISVKDGYVQAVKDDERNATPWSMG